MACENTEIMTILGPITADQLGPTYMHEHLIVDCSFSGNNPLKKVDDIEALTWEMKDVLRAGGQTVVDCTCVGLAPQPTALKKIAQETGINIITSTGFYRKIVYPDYVSTLSAEQLAERLIKDCRDGFDDTDIRPGMLGEFASHDDGPPDENVEKVFRAAALAHCATGLPIATHCWVGVGSDWQIDILKREGADLSKVIIGHAAASRPDIAILRSILDCGANIGV
ncbi:unnamed protein product, partial [marine sediment metagenome]